MGRHLLRALLGLLAACLLALPLAAEERITFFRSDLTVATDGTFTVTETINVISEGNQIRRGIYRDFPLRFRTADGRTVTAGFKLLSATRDGQPETTRVQRGSGMVRIYLGKKDVFLQNGKHYYQITYRTDRWMRFFKDHDEVYWNATGTEWLFPIDHAEAVIRLPEGAKILKTAVFTGAHGATGHAAEAEIAPDGRTAVFQTTAPLGPREGLTVDVSVAKGAVAPPTEAQMRDWWLRAHVGSVIAWAAAALAFAYYLFAWIRVGRDPKGGPIVPRWDMPEGVSPAQVNYIANKGLPGKGFTALSAAALSLAVKGQLTFNEVGEEMTLKRNSKGAPARDLPVGERAILTQLQKEGGALTLSRDNGAAVKTLGQKFRAAMEGEHRGHFYRHNSGWIAAGIIFSALGGFAAAVMAGVTEESSLAVIPAMIFVTVALLVGMNIARNLGGGRKSKIRLVFTSFILLMFVVNGAGGFLGAALSEGALAGNQGLFTAAMATLLAVNVLFFFLLGAPTALGRERMDQIEGLRRYLVLAEKDRMNMQGAPQMSPGHFETLLPYAVALGVEKPWSKAFDGWLAAAAAAGVAGAATYAPAWYRGVDFRDTRIGDSLGRMAGSLSSSLTASLPVESSSSSGFSGGGSSGGGGGGGGGGGW